LSVLFAEKKAQENDWVSTPTGELRACALRLLAARANSYFFALWRLIGAN
jgi:hypothetical protein